VPGNLPGKAILEMTYVVSGGTSNPTHDCSTTSALVAPRTVHSTIGDCTFAATAASVWNSLLELVRSSPSLQVFCSRLKTELFAWSYRHD